MAHLALPLRTSQIITSTPRDRSPSVSRDIVLWLDAAASRPRDAGPIWNSLIRGERTVDDAFSDGARAYLILRRTPNAGQERTMPLPRHTEMLRRLVLGQSQKAISIDLGVTPSTVALSLSRCMARLGLSCRAQNLPLALALLGQAAHEAVEAADLRVSAYESDPERYEIVSMARPDLMLPAVLSLAEQAVARQVVEGTTHSEAASLRGTSRRTIANQLSAIFRKLGVSGRFELVCRLSVLAVAQPVAAPALVAAGGTR